MFSNRTIIIAVLLIGTGIYIANFYIHADQPPIYEHIGPLSFFSPILYVENIIKESFSFLKNIWVHYFFLITVAKENDELKQDLDRAIQKNNQCIEIELSNQRLREFLNFQKKSNDRMIAAEVISKDPSQWYQSVIVDKGKLDGLKTGMPVLVPDGIVGQIVESTPYYSKVLLITDRNSAVDALVQRTRARGIVKGDATDKCFFDYALQKHDIQTGDVIVSSGLDGVYPKGIRIGEVIEAVKQHSGIFQEVIVKPFVDFERIEELLIIVSGTNINTEDSSLTELMR
ncbi:MAG: rod shape-determining protein MreC [Desulfobacterales bacterium]|nr:rod shape-determining protein MreC [Desulfobacterales bacterium]